MVFGVVLVFVKAAVSLGVFKDDAVNAGWWGVRVGIYMVRNDGKQTKMTGFYEIKV